MEEEIDLKNLFKMFWDRKLGIIVIILICTVIGAVYTTFFTTPTYLASSTVILAKSGEGQTSETVTQSELTINDKLVSTYSELAKSDAVVREVISNLSLKNTSAEALKKQITVTAVKNSQVIKVSVENTDPNLAAKIANETTNVFSEKVSEVYNMDNIYVLDKAETPKSPNNINHKKDIILFVAVGIVLAIGYVVVANLLDNTIKSAKDIESITGLPVLAEMPLCDFNNRKGRRK